MKWKHASPPALAVALKALGQQLSSNISLFESAKWLLAEPLCQNSLHNHSEGGTLDKFIVTAVCVCVCVSSVCGEEGWKNRGKDKKKKERRGNRLLALGSVKSTVHPKQNVKETSKKNNVRKFLLPQIFLLPVGFFSIFFLHSKSLIDCLKV